MTRRSVSLPTLLLWVLMALLPLRSVASAWMVAAPMPTGASAALPPCHGADDADTIGQSSPDPAAGASSFGQGACHHCDLCHSPTLVSSLTGLAAADITGGVWLTSDARVATATQQPQRRPPRA